MKYTIYREDFEISAKVDSDKIIDAAFDNGLQNGSYDVLESYDTIQDAKEALKYFSCHVEKVKNNGIGYYKLEMFYYAEIDDDGEQTGNYEVAEIMRYQVRDSITEEIFDVFSDVEEAYFAVNAYEELDKKYNQYTEKAYEIYDTITEKVV